MNFEDILHSCDAAVRAGQAQKVNEHLEAIELARIPRRLKCRFANVCRRASLLSIGLKILAPVIRDQTAEPSFEEKAEYAVLLQRSGAVHEALLLLREVDANVVPESHLFTAFCHFNLWDYDRAIQPLQSYLRAPLSPYAQLVGRVNLCAAFVATGQLEEALNLATRNVEMARKLKAERLEGNSLELVAQVLIFQKQYVEARQVLAEARHKLKQENTIDHLFVRKWIAILDSIETQKIEPLDEFRVEAMRFGDWESVREVDLYRLKIEFNREKFEHLYFGTPFPAYRARISRDLGAQPESDVFIFPTCAGPRGVDLRTGSADKIRLAGGKKVHQVLRTLLSDFYRPFTIGGLFARLFPGEFFDPFSSPARVHQLLRRTRRWLEQAAAPVAIQNRDGMYSLRINGAFSFIVPLDSADQVDTHSVLLQKLKLALHKTKSVSTHEACLKLELSPSSFKRFTQWAVKTGHLEREGAGPSTRYKLIA